jgi:hypothetical protein
VKSSENCIHISIALSFASLLDIINFYTLDKTKLTMSTMKTVAEVPRRNYSTTPYTANLRNNDGVTDLGGPHADMEAEVLRLAKIAKAAVILSSQNPFSMSKNVKDALTTRLQIMEATPQPWSNNHIKSMAGVRKDLMDENKHQLDRNALADLVIGIRHQISARNYQIFMDQVQRPFDINSEEALVEIMRRSEEEFFAEPYVRRQQINDMVQKVGLAHTQPELMLLIGILGDIYDHTADWLAKTDSDGIRQLYDPMTPQVGEDEKLRSLLVRMSGASHPLATYRSLVSTKLDEKDTFDSAVQEIKKKSRTDIPSFDQMPQRGSDTVLVARVEDASRIEESIMAYQAGFQMASAQSDKRQRQEEVRPYASAPYVAKEVDGGTGRGAHSSLVTCYYWDGGKCDYEVSTKKQCRFQDAHKEGVSTFIKPYAAKQSDMEQFMEFKRMKEQQMHSSQK